MNGHIKSRSACLIGAKGEVVFSQHAYGATLPAKLWMMSENSIEGFLNGLPGWEDAAEAAPNYRACFGSPLARIPDRFG